MIFLISLFVALHVQTNNPQIKKIEELVLIEVLNSIAVEKYYQTQEFSVSIFKKANPPGSAGVPEGHEISHSYYLAISEFDEYPETSLFLVGGFYNPEMKIEEAPDIIILEIEYGAYNKRITKKYAVGLHSVRELS